MQICWVFLKYVSASGVNVNEELNTKACDIWEIKNYFFVLLDVLFPVLSSILKNHFLPFNSSVPVLSETHQLSSLTLTVMPTNF